MAVSSGCSNGGRDCSGLFQSPSAPEYTVYLHRLFPLCGVQRNLNCTAVFQEALLSGSTGQSTVAAHLTTVLPIPGTPSVQRRPGGTNWPLQSAVPGKESGKMLRNVSPDHDILSPVPSRSWRNCLSIRCSRGFCFSESRMSPPAAKIHPPSGSLGCSDPAVPPAVPEDRKDPASGVCALHPIQNPNLTVCLFHDRR